MVLDLKGRHTRQRVVKLTGESPRPSSNTSTHVPKRRQKD